MLADLHTLPCPLLEILLISQKRVAHRDRLDLGSVALLYPLLRCQGKVLLVPSDQEIIGHRRVFHPLSESRLLT